MADREEAEAHLVKHAGLSEKEAEELVKSVVDAAASEAIDAIADDAPPPSAVADARAARVVRICSELGRLLRPIEVEVILRVPSTTAVSILNRVRALYPRFADEWTKQLIASQANRPTDIGTSETPDRWRLVFGDPVVVDYAYDRLRREGMTRDVARRPAEQALEFPRTIRNRHGVERSAFEVLGVDGP